MDSRLSAIRRQFNRSAKGSYDTHALVQRRMTDWLANSLLRQKSRIEVAKPDILEIGCGTGALTEVLLHNWPLASIKALDLAPAMLEAAKKRVRTNETIPDAAQISFLLADVETWAADAQSATLDLIVSGACFQWLNSPSETLCHLRRLLRPGGLLAFTTFGPDTFRELHESFDNAYRAADMEPQRHGLSLQTADRWQALLNDAGFSITQVGHFTQVENYPSVKDFLHAVKAVGASASEAAVSHGLGLRPLFTNMFKYYEDKFSLPGGGGVSATYDLLLVHAENPSTSIDIPLNKR